MLGQLHRTSSWLIGDLLNHIERVYGETYAQAAEATGLSKGALMNYTVGLLAGFLARAAGQRCRSRHI